MLRLSKGQPIEELKYSFAVISPRIIKIEDEKLVFPTKQSKKAHIQLLPKNQTQKTLIEQAQNQYWQINQILLTPNWCTIPLTRYLNLTQEKEDNLIQKLTR
jgi:1,2-phenylacetyl-CoA epoxidase catalytic subunit